MTLRRDNSLQADIVRVQCIRCLHMHYLNTVWIDTEGPAFRAYWCEGCKPTDSEDAQRIYMSRLGVGV